MGYHLEDTHARKNANTLSLRLFCHDSAKHKQVCFFALAAPKIWFFSRLIDFEAAPRRYSRSGKCK